ncbi:MAG: YkgJ family cysteine cluster protein, partial [Polyangiales bacterium]
PEAWSKVDWGLCNEDARHLEREHACLRLQAAWTSPYGLRQMLAPTTEHRSFYDGLPHDPLSAGPHRDPSGLALAQDAWRRSARSPWAPHLHRALGATMKIARLVQDAGTKHETLWSHFNPEATLASCRGPC